MQYDELNRRYQDAAKELLPSLSEAGGGILQGKIEIQAGEPASLSADFKPEHEYPLLKVALNSTTDAAYEHSLLMDKSMAGLIFSWTSGVEQPEEIGEEQLDAVKQMTAQILEQAQTALDGKEFSFTAGDIQLTEIASLDDLQLPVEGLVVTYRFNRGDEKEEYLVTHLVNGDIVAEDAEEEAVEESAEVPAEESAAEGAVDEAAEGEASEEPAEESGTGEEAEAIAEDQTDEESVISEETEGVGSELPLEGAEDLDGMTDLDALFSDESDRGESVEVSPAQFDELAGTLPPDGKGRKIDMLLDVELNVSVELGRKNMVVGEILRLGKGSVVELNKLAGEPVDVLVNGKKLAEGEVVVVEDHFGVRLTHLLEPAERIKSLGK